MEELSAILQHRRSPQTAPRKQAQALVERFNPRYVAVSVKDIGGEGAVVKIKNELGEDAALKIALPNITESYEDTHVFFALKFFREKRNIDAERFKEGVRLQRNLARLLRAESVPYLFVPDVIRVYATPTLAYEMQWIDSVGLLPWLRERKSLAYSLSLFRTLLKCVLYLHSRGIVHRDLKSDNIMMAGEQALWLVDWTVGKCLTEERSLTQVGAAIGTFPYASPKVLSQRMARDASYTDDLHALGYILWEVVRGQALPKIPNGAEFDEAAQAAYRDARAWEIEEPFRSVFLAATHPDERLRYGTVEEFDSAVAAAIRDAGLEEGDAPAGETLDDRLLRECARCPHPWCLGTGLCRTIIKECLRYTKE